MRAGKKAAVETGKTRPCIVYVKKLKGSEATEIINAAASGKKSKILPAAKVPTRRIQNEKELERERERETPRATRTSKRAASIANFDHQLSKGRTLITKRNSNVRGEVSTVPKAKALGAAATTKPVAASLSKRRNTEIIIPIGRTCTSVSKRRDTIRHIDSDPKSKMYKQSKVAVTPVAAPPPTIAASRSRRSIKPNPKYASDDMVTPKYVATLASESSNKRTVKHLFADEDDDDEDEDLHDMIEEDNDDDLNDAAFNPQLHKSDEDDISEIEFEQQLRREKVPPKRGRGRPPKNANASVATSNALSQAPRGMSQTGRGGGVSNLQQLRRTIAATVSMARKQMTAGSGGTVSNKRKLEDNSEPQVPRKRVATEFGRTAPVINGRTSVAKTSAIGLASNQPKSKVVVGSNISNNNSGVRLMQETAVKQRPGSNFKATQPATAARSGGVTMPRLATAARQTVSIAIAAAVKAQKAKAADAGAAAATATAAAASNVKSRESDDVPTFTIVNIDDIINQDDVLIKRSSNQNHKKQTPAARNNNNNNNNNSRTNQMQSSSAPTSASSAGSNSSKLGLHSGGKQRAKTSLAATAPATITATTVTTKGTTTTVMTTKSSLTANHNKQPPIVIKMTQTKPRPRILNAEMGKKTKVMMKPLMSMGKELCPMPDGGDTEDEDITSDLADDDNIIITSPLNTQTRSLRRTQSAKWLPPRRNILSAATGNNQRYQQQQKQPQQVGSPGTDRKLSKLLGESSDDDVFKKPASPSTSMSTSTSTSRRSKENAAAAAVAADAENVEATAAAAAEIPETETVDKHPKYFPPETTTYCEEDGRIVKKITCYETWHVISTPKESTSKTRQQRTCLELPLTKLANVATRIKVPSAKWTSKVTLYKVSPSLMQRQTMTIYTGDLKIYNIPEEERHKYQPSCVLFRRSVLDRSKCRVPFDRAIIFKNKCYYANIEGKHVNLLGAPEVVNSVKDVEMLIDIVDSLALSSDLVEMVTSK